MHWKQDLRVAARRLAATPGETVAALVVLAVGVGVNLAVFAVVHGVLVRPLPYAEPDALALVSVVAGDGTDFGVPPDEIDAWRRHLGTVSSVGAFVRGEAVLRGSGAPRRARVARVDEGFFATLGVGAARGRLDELFASPRLVLSGRLASSADLALGDGVTVDDELLVDVALEEDALEEDGLESETRIVAATMPPRFAFPDGQVEAWLPMRSIPGERSSLLVRRRAGVSLEALRADAGRALRAIRGDAYEAGSDSGRVLVTPLEDAVVGSARPALAAACVAALLIVLVTCGNVALLRLGRGALQRRELVVRLALGAGRRHLVAGAFAEALLLAGAGTALGLALAQAILALMRALVPTLPRLGEVTLGGRAALAAVAVAVALAVLLAALSVLGGPRRGVGLLAGVGRGGSPRAGLGLATLVVLQVAASLVLVVGAALLARTQTALTTQDLGLEADGVVVAALQRGQAAGPADPFATGLLERVRALPGVEAAGLGSDLPPRSAPFTIFIRVLTGGRDEGRPFSLVGVTPGYLEALGVRSLESVGSAAGLAAPDVTDTTGVTAAPDTTDASVVLSRSAAAFLVPAGGDRLQQRLPGVPWSEPPRIAGRVDDVKFLGLDQPSRAVIYLPWGARPSPRMHLAVRLANLEHGDRDAAAIAPALRRIVRALDPSLPPPAVTTLDEHLASTVADRRARLVGALALAGVALLVALAGIVGLFLRLVAEGRREAAIRLAIGARPGGVVARMLRRAARLVGVGLALGLGGSLAAGALLESLLYGVAPHDPAALAAATVVVAATALLAALWPSRRLADIAPASVLRDESLHSSTR